MRCRVVSEGKYIVDSIVEELNLKRRNGEKGDDYSNILRYSFDELVKRNMRDIAQESWSDLDQNEMVNRSVEEAEYSVKKEMRKRGFDFDIRRYTSESRKLLGPLAKEISDLRKELDSARRSGRIGLRIGLEEHGAVPFEIVEIGLKGLTEGLICVPTTDVFELNLGAVEDFCRSPQDRFPVEIEINEFVYVIDDDGSLFISTENFPDKLMEQARQYLVELCKQIYLLPN
jgi:hypothetical protein